ncbi:MAG TPA: lamin tail domain-containing protein, partial [Prolixibacteraceae bacterium]
MKDLTQRHIIRTILALVSILVFAFAQPVNGQSVTLAKWDFPAGSNNAVADVGGIPVNQIELIHAFGTNAIAFNTAGPSTYAASSIGWDNGTDTKYWSVDCNTQGYTSLTLSSKQRSDLTGPKDFKIQYRVDGGSTWNDAPSAIVSVADDWTTGALNINLPTVCDNQPDLQLRWVMTSNTSVNNGTVANDGSSLIDDIIIQGNACNVTITSFAPLTGPVGTSVTITGSNFTGVSKVLFNDSEASYLVVDATTIVATVPFIFTSGPITVVGANCSNTTSTAFQLINACPGNGSNLIISELCDPYYDFQTSRYIEIYNPTNHIIPLTGWSVEAISDGLDWFRWDLSGSIAPGQALTCGNSYPAKGGPHTFTDINWNSVFGCCGMWNGQRRDGAILYNRGSVIDYVYYENSTTGWFSDQTLVRNPDVSKPSTTTNIAEWTAYSVTNIDDHPSPATPRSHTSNGNPTLPIIDSQPSGMTVKENDPASLTLSASNGVPPYNFKWKLLNAATNSWEYINAKDYSVTNEPTNPTL